MWESLTDYQTIMRNTGELMHKREQQKRIWMWNYIHDNILDMFKNHPNVRQKIPHLEEQVCKGILTPGTAADILIKGFVS